MAPQRHWKSLLVVLALVALVALIALRWSGTAAETRALESMPPAERAALYEQTLHSAQALCAQAGTSDALLDRCVDSVDFLLRFPECDDACRTLARAHRRAPTR